MLTLMFRINALQPGWPPAAWYCIRSLPRQCGRGLPETTRQDEVLSTVRSKYTAGSTHGR